jgi:hypothetical protein
VGEELERLARLQASGDLTNDEFQALKARLLKGLLPEETASPVVEEPSAIGNEPGPDPVGETPTREPGAEELPAVADNESEPVARPAVEAESLRGDLRSRARSRYNDDPLTVLRRQRNIVTELDTVRKPKKIIRFVITFLVLGVAVTGGVLLLQDRTDSPNPGDSDSSRRSAIEVSCQVEMVWDSAHVFWHWAEVKTTVWSDGSIDKVDLGYPIYGGVEGFRDLARSYTGAPCRRLTLP